MDKIIQKKKKMFAYIFLFIILFSFLGNTCKAEINTDYGDSSTVSDVDLEKSMKGSVLLDAIAQLLYALASWVEHAVGVGFAQLTGSNEFPWADRIIFNTIRMLDINFINPSNGSMFNTSSGSDTILAKIVKNVYYTVLSLAVGFLGVAVGIMAVRLAISTIASEKARYKEAIMNWLLGIVMLFTMHFILSFVFYTNEQMVKIASKVLTNAIENAGVRFDFTELANSVISPEDRFKNYCDSNNLNETYNSLLPQRRKIAGYLISDSEYVSKRLPDSLDPGNGQELSVSLNIIADTINNWTWATNYRNGARITDKAHTLTEDSAWAQVVYNAKESEILDLSSLENFKSTLPNLSRVSYYYRTFTYNDSIFWGVFNNTTTSFEGYFPEYAMGMSVCEVIINNFDRIRNGSFTEDELQNQALNLAYEYTKSLYKAASFANGGGISGSADNLISGMGNYFKRTAFVYTSEVDESSGETTITGWRASKITLTGALLYAIFIIQSLMYFIQYIKRFFYIIILSLIGPAVVIYDFVTKSIK